MGADTTSTTVTGRYVRQPQPWAVDQERGRHEQALYLYGEYTLFVLMWTASDYDNNLVTLCPVCSADPISAAYGQPTRNKCPSCFGNRFNGGYRALIFRPAIFGDTDDGQSFTKRGVTTANEVFIESTSDFRVHSGDYAMRATGERYQLRTPTRAALRTGFVTPYQVTSSVSYNVASAQVEDQDSVAYTIPPNTDDLISLLTMNGTTPVDYTSFEVMRAPLIPLYERD